MPDSIMTHCTTAASNINATRDEPKIRKYELLLATIARSFGFGDIESSTLVREVCSEAVRHFQYQENVNQIRILLSKMMVQKCIFKISSEYFSSGNHSAQKTGINSLKYYSNWISGRTRSIPLSLKTVFVLHRIGFSEPEISKILNTSTLTAKERLNKAMTMIAMHHE